MLKFVNEANKRDLLNQEKKIRNADSVRGIVPKRRVKRSNPATNKRSNMA